MQADDPSSGDDHSSSSYSSGDGVTEQWSSTPRSSKSQAAASPRKWSAAEDVRLTRAVHDHGEANWKSIAHEVQSRSHVQVSRT
jgi:Myb-like DNA-binding domain